MDPISSNIQNLHVSHKEEPLENLIPFLNSCKKSDENGHEAISEYVNKIKQGSKIELIGKSNPKEKKINSDEDKTSLFPELDEFEEDLPDMLTNHQAHSLNDKLEVVEVVDEIDYPENISSKNQACALNDKLETSSNQIDSNEPHTVSYSNEQKKDLLKNIYSKLQATDDEELKVKNEKEIETVEVNKSASEVNKSASEVNKSASEANKSASEVNNSIFEVNKSSLKTNEISNNYFNFVKQTKNFYLPDHNQLNLVEDPEKNKDIKKLVILDEKNGIALAFSDSSHPQGAILYLNGKAFTVQHMSAEEEEAFLHAWTVFVQMSTQQDDNDKKDKKSDSIENKSTEKSTIQNDSQIAKNRFEAKLQGPEKNQGPATNNNNMERSLDEKDKIKHYVRKMDIQKEELGKTLLKKIVEYVRLSWDRLQFEYNKSQSSNKDHSHVFRPNPLTLLQLLART